LLETLVTTVPDVRFRLSSIEATEVDDRIARLLIEAPRRLAAHLHAPLQSGADRVLKRMGRHWYSAASYRARIEWLAARLPAFGLGADVIAAFPGETDADHRATLALIDALPFTYLHVFPFSRRPDTPADGMRNQVHGAVIRERGRILRELAAEKNRSFREAHLGRTLRVLTFGESTAEGTLSLTDNYLKVRLRGERLPANQWVKARIVSTGDGCLIAERAGSPPRDFHATEEFPSMMTCASA
jgi:threonylcarbamoyladenosine tRNA methylthiotransferase MtaB